MTLMHAITSALDVEFLTFLLIGIAAILVLWRRKATRRQWTITLVTLAAVAALHTPAAGYLALATLERSVPREKQLPKDITAIVVLSGGMHQPANAGEEPLPAEDSIYRCLHAAKIYHEQPERMVILSGGHVDSQDGPSLAEVMQQFMLRRGIPKSHILLESRSTTTYENAKFCAELIKARDFGQVILVTNAYHLPRAELCFQSQGIAVVPSAARYQTGDFRWTIASCLPHAGSIRAVQLAFHEWLGILWYTVRCYV